MMFQVTPRPESNYLTIVLELPSKWLQPNNKPGTARGRMQQSRIVKQYRSDAKDAAQIAAHECGELVNTMPWRAATVQATFYHKDSRKRDRDNLLSSLKSAFDGIRDAGVLLDDDELTHLPVVREKDKEQPRVELVLWQEV